MASDYHVGQPRNGTFLFLQKVLLATSSGKKSMLMHFLLNQLNGEVEVDFSIA